MPQRDLRCRLQLRPVRRALRLVSGDCSVNRPLRRIASLANPEKDEPDAQEKKENPWNDTPLNAIKFTLATKRPN